MNYTKSEVMESIEQTMRTLKLGGLAKEWRNVAYRDSEQYMRELLEIEVREREANRINRMIKQAGFRVIKTLDKFNWKHWSQYFQFNYIIYQQFTVTFIFQKV